MDNRWSLNGRGHVKTFNTTSKLNQCHINIYFNTEKANIKLLRKININTKDNVFVMVKSYISIKMISFQCHVYTLWKMIQKNPGGKNNKVALKFQFIRVDHNEWSTMVTIAILKNLTIGKGKLVTTMFVQVERYPVLLWVTLYCEQDCLKYGPSILPFQCIQTLLN